MQSEFKLFKVKGGILRFARVTVEAEPALSEIEVTHSIVKLVDPEWSRHPYLPDQRWIEAAMRGAHKSGAALLHLKKMSGCRVVVARILGTDVDTNEEDVTCASALATWQALLPGNALPTFDFYDGIWHLDFT